jgi:hypothetical protein
MKIIITAEQCQHQALKDDACSCQRTIAQHTLHLALQAPTVSERLAALLKRKTPAKKGISK